MSGYFKLYRELLNKPIWLNSSNEQRVILITLLAMANWKETEWDYYGEKIKLNPGQFIASAPAIKERCNSSEITIMKIRTALERFEKLDFLTVSLTGKSTKSGKLITIVNWRHYQSNEEEDNRQNNRQNNKEITDRQPTDNRHIKEEGKEYKELKEDKEKGFERFWELYPSKRKKPVARIAWMNMRVHSEEQYALINAAVERYKKTNQWQEENGRYIPDPDTFLQDERWTDEIKLSEAVQAADREAQEKDEWIAKNKERWAAIPPEKRKYRLACFMGLDWEEVRDMPYVGT
ncbi:hypothetical protein [Phascolarctobacterium faecium]|uniref:hypothetical protein n=1 Tax=Phascolarctobacterium faecium TaxID=33025 RepID=UPI003AB43112